MLVSVVIPVFNEEKYIHQCIQSVVDNKEPEFDIEIIVIDGGSTDNTKKIISQFSEVILLDNPKQTTPFAMNIGVKHCKGDIMIRLDGHAVMKSKFISNCLQELELHPECGCVGGYIENVSTNITSEAIALAMKSVFGVGGAKFRTGNFEGYVDTLAFGAYRKEVFEKIGFFDEQLVRNQDDDFNFRLTQSGSKIWLSMKIKSKYAVRSSFLKLFRQYFQYGYWKVFVNKKHGTFTSYRQLAPIAIVLFLGLGWLSCFINPILFNLYLLGCGAYAGLGMIAAFMSSPKINIIYRIFFSFYILHISYGLGYLQGIIDFLFMNRNPGQYAKASAVTR
jgi:glycosyltransferase involved in cell wall biosynthesis